MLRKDFTIDEVQVYESRAIGADAILLIAAAVTDDELLADLHALARDLGLAVLVEAHDAAEIDRALAAGAEIVGVNNRDLGDVRGGPRCRRVARRADPGCRWWRSPESAVRTPGDAARLGAVGFDAVLVGEALVRADDPTRLVRDLGAAPVNRRS